MKQIIKKTKEEREKDETFEEIKVKDTAFYYWACDYCNVAFFGDDTIIKSNKGGANCINCKKRILGGDEKCFDEYYKIKS